MTGSLTIRLSAAQRRALRARAAAAGKTESEIVRDMLDRDLQSNATIGERAGRHFGRLDAAPRVRDDDPWRAHLQQANRRK